MIITLIADIDECSSNPCKNQAFCYNDINKYECTCQPGWVGVNCDIGKECARV